jgi:hypothetical protein
MVIRVLMSDELPFTDTSKLAIIYLWAYISSEI